MKKLFVLGAAVLAVAAMTSCKTSKESAYRKAYEKAKAQEQVVEQQPTQQVVETPVVTPVQSVQSKVVDNYDNEAVRQENLTVVNGAGLKAYSQQCWLSGADRLQQCPQYVPRCSYYIRKQGRCSKQPQPAPCHLSGRLAPL